MNGYLFLAVIVGVSIIAVMAGYAGYLLYQLRQQTVHRQRKLRERSENILESIHLLANLVHRDELILSEGAIRICELLNAMPLGPGNYRQSYPTLFELYDEVKKLPRGEERKNYPKQEIMRMDWERTRLETAMADRIKAEAQQVLQLTL